MFIVLIPSYGCSTEGIVKSCLFLFIAFSALATNLRCAFTNPGTVQDKVHVSKSSLFDTLCIDCRLRRVAWTYVRRKASTFASMMLCDHR